MALLSIIVPCYNEASNIPKLYQVLTRCVADCQKQFDLTAECIFVDDGSSDGTMDVLRGLSGDQPQIRYLSFSRNFGKEAAIIAGLEAAKGDYLVMMDADLQDPPEMLATMLSGIVDEGYDCVATRRVTRKGEPLIRSFFARRFYHLLRKWTQIEIADGARDYRMMTRQMVDAVLRLQESNRFSKGIFGWVGFKTKWIPFENVARQKGESKWSFWKLVIYALDGLMAFSSAPLAFSSIIGPIFCLIAAVMIVIIIVKTLVWGDPVAGYPSMICVIFLIGGIQLFCIGILGQYLSRTYLETKKRPLYIIKEKSNGPADMV